MGQKFIRYVDDRGTRLMAFIHQVAVAKDGNRCVLVEDPYFDIFLANGAFVMNDRSIRYIAADGTPWVATLKWESIPAPGTAPCTVRLKFFHQPLRGGNPHDDDVVIYKTWGVDHACEQAQPYMRVEQSGAQYQEFQTKIVG